MIAEVRAWGILGNWQVGIVMRACCVESKIVFHKTWKHMSHTNDFHDACCAFFEELAI